MNQPSRPCRPYGNPTTATIWFLGHDPRLRINDAEAETCFFLDLLDKPKSKKEGRTRQLAQNVLNYIEKLSGRTVSRSELYVTNICNDFLERPQARGAVFIPAGKADEGVQAISRALGTAASPPAVIISSSQQVLYHLARTGFLKAEPELERFKEKSVPKEEPARNGAYVPSKTTAFLEVCGKNFWHERLPVVPVLHISSYRRMSPQSRYTAPMEKAAAAIQLALRRHITSSNR